MMKQSIFQKARRHAAASILKKKSLYLSGANRDTWSKCTVDNVIGRHSKSLLVRMTTSSEDGHRHREFSLISNISEFSRFYVLIRTVILNVLGSWNSTFLKIKDGSRHQFWKKTNQVINIIWTKFVLRINDVILCRALVHCE